MSTLPTPSRHRFRLSLVDDRFPGLTVAGRVRPRRRLAPVEVVYASEHPERLVQYNDGFRELGYNFVPVATRLETVVNEVGQRRPGALVLDLSELTGHGLELAQQIALREDFLALPIVLVLPEFVRPGSLPTHAVNKADRADDRLLTVPQPTTPLSIYAHSATTKVYPGINHPQVINTLTTGPAAQGVGSPTAHALLNNSSAGLGFVGGAMHPWSGTPTNPFALSPEAHAALGSLIHNCSDFVFAPITPYELAVRLNRLTREVESPSGEFVTTAGPIVIDDRAHTVTAGGRAINLRKKEYDLLQFLVRNAGVVFTRDALLRWVWGPGFTGDARTVDVHIRRLRSKLGNDIAEIIETVRRVGYRLSVSALDGSSANADSEVHPTVGVEHSLAGVGHSVPPIV